MLTERFSQPKPVSSFPVQAARDAHIPTARPAPRRGLRRQIADVSLRTWSPVVGVDPVVESHFAGFLVRIFFDALAGIRREVGRVITHQESAEGLECK